MIKKVAIMQPYFFPYIGYYQLIDSCDTFIIYDDVNYKKRSWMSRNYIVLNKQKFMINLFLSGASQLKKINEININLEDNKKILTTFKHAYHKSPYFQDVLNLINDIFKIKEENYSNFLLYSILKICEYLEINTQILISSDIKKNNDLKKEDKILHICKLLNATDYINAIGGESLYSKEFFKKNNLNLHFIKSNDIYYNQLSDEFYPNLSIIDILMNNSILDVKKMLKEYKLI